MYKSTNHHHLSTRGSSLVWGLVAFTVTGLALLFVLSPVVETRVVSWWSDHFEWGPEQIPKNPEGFIRHAEGRATNAIEQAEAHSFRINHSRIRNERQLTSAKAKDTSARELLAEHRDAYLEAGEAAWPVEVAGFKYDQAALKSQIVDLKRAHDFYASETAQRRELHQEYEQELREAEDAQRRAKQLLTQLTRLRELLIIEETEVELDELEDIIALVETMSDARGPVPSAGKLIEREQDQRATDDAFEEILNMDLSEL